MSLADLGERVGKSKQFLQRLEAGYAAPTDDLMEAIAVQLCVAPAFFTRQSLQPLVSEAFHFRKLLTTRSADVQTAMAKGELFRRLIAFFETRLSLPSLDFPSFPISTPELAERAAEKARQHWSLGFGPIGSMVRVLENAGAVVTSFGETSRTIDAMCIASTRPIVVANITSASGSRIRFDHAHELGHFVGHHGEVTGDRAKEAEANRFASAFLLPRTSFAREFPALRGGSQINWIALSAMKARWGVSKSALLYRAKQLRILTDDQYRRSLVGHLYGRGERHVEKDEHLVPAEQPELLVNAARALLKSFGLSMEMLAQALLITPAMLRQIAPSLDLVEVRQPEGKVVSLSEFAQRRLASSVN